MKIRVFVVEDSPLQLEVLTEHLKADGDIEVVGSANSGHACLIRIPILRPDLVVMDGNLPGMSGPQAIAKLLEVYPVPVVLFTESPEKWKDSAEQAGAVAVLSKNNNSTSFASLRKTVRLMNGLKIVKRYPRTNIGHSPKQYLLIASSSGGPGVVESVLKSVHPKSGTTVVLVQHLSPSSTEFFINWLTKTTGWPCLLCESSNEMLPGHIYMASAGHHMKYSNGSLVLEESTNKNEFSPSATVLFRSFAEACPKKVVALVASGIGDDGAKGLVALRMGGAVTLAQDPSEAAVSGMPESAIAYGGAARVVPTKELGPTVKACLDGKIV